MLSVIIDVVSKESNDFWYTVLFICNNYDLMLRSVERAESVLISYTQE